MLQVLIKKGGVFVENVPAPGIEPGCVLVRVEYSCVSVGTELSGIRSSGQSLIQHAAKQPERITQAVRLAVEQGPDKVYELIKDKLSASSPTGYSASGTVLETGPDIICDFRPGDRVACAGAEWAHHAEFIRVPRNLTVQIPDGVHFAAASTVTLGAIALQGVRRANPTLGETFAVIGLGVIGQLTVQILRANGCSVVGVDVEPSRLALAMQLGMNAQVQPGCCSEVEQVIKLTGGAGCDGVIVTAATPSDAVIASAFQMCRKKGRVVLVGDVGLNINRADIYAKELDFFVSTSYGPGRYDRRYEEEGLDYPLGFVRWTENRNMLAYLQLLAENRINIAPLIAAIYPVEKAPEAYASLTAAENRPLTVLLRYPVEQQKKPERIVRLSGEISHIAKSIVQIRLAVAGAGSFAKMVHLPNIRRLQQEYYLRTVVCRDSHNAGAAARRFNADCAATDYAEVLADSEVDAVLICTRHNLHASMVMEALKAGKHVFVEKPLSVTTDELEQIRSFFENAGKSRQVPVLMTGFNRRFSPMIQQINKIIKNRTSPLLINYRMNAGYIPPTSWEHGPEGGGRNIGEACHIYDLFTFLTSAPVSSVAAVSLQPPSDYYTSRDNFVATIAFNDGSLAVLTYTALGNKGYPKESMELHWDGKTIQMEDYKRLSFFGCSGRNEKHWRADKGHKNELLAFAQAIRTGDGSIMPLWQQFQAMEIAFQVEDALRG